MIHLTLIIAAQLTNVCKTFRAHAIDPSGQANLFRVLDARNYKLFY